MYIMKVQGSEKIPDHIQIRDENFKLIAYFKITRPDTALNRCNLLHKKDDILGFAARMEYGKIQKLVL